MNPMRSLAATIALGSLVPPPRAAVAPFRPIRKES
jgi:hypothetical protein